MIGLGFDAPPSEAEFAAAELAFTSAGSEVRAEVATLARAETHAWLSRRGYHLQGFEHVLGQPLNAQTWRDPLDADGRAEVDVRVVGDHEIGETDTWVRTVTAGFAAPDASGAGGDAALPSGEALAAVLDDAFRVPGNARYLATVAGEVAGGASMRVGGGIALLAGASTLPAFRRRGVQRALLRARLSDAARAGCELAVVVTQPGSISQANVQRAGFGLLYARAVLVKA